MKRVGWLADTANADGTLGGAELTQQEFKLAAPDGVEVVNVPAGGKFSLLADCDVVCVFNCVSYPWATSRALAGKKVIRYWNDMAVHGDVDLTAWLVAHATNVFTSPLHAERFPYMRPDGKTDVLIPPPVDLQPFREAAENSQERKGAVSVAAWMNPGKAAYRAAEYGAGNGASIDFFGGGPFAPSGSEQVAYDDMPALLAKYATFVFLPDAVEPFGRLVVEAHAAGCRLVVNENVGSRYWLEKEPEKLESAAEDFWSVVLEKS